MIDEPEVFLTECDVCGKITDCMKRERGDEDEGGLHPLYLCGGCR